jgi:hypothetical protein
LQGLASGFTLKNLTRLEQTLQLILQQPEKKKFYDNNVRMEPGSADWCKKTKQLGDFFISLLYRKSTYLMKKH